MLSLLFRHCPDDAKHRDWTRFLSELATIAAPHAESVCILWANLSRAIAALPIPEAGPTADGAFQFVWDRDRYHLDIDIRDDGTMDWFYSDRNSGKSDMGDDTNVSDGVPSQLHSYLAAFFVP